MIWSGRPVGWAIGGQILIKIMYICHKSTELQYMLCRNVLHLCPHVPSKSAWWWWVDLDISSEYISWFPSPPPIEGSAGCRAEAGANRAGNKPWRSLKFSQYPCWKQLQPVSHLRTYHTINPCMSNLVWVSTICFWCENKTYLILSIFNTVKQSYYLKL